MLEINESKTSSHPDQEDLREQLMKMVLEDLMNLPAYRLKGEYKDIFEQYSLSELRRKVSSYSIDQSNENKKDNHNYHLYISKLYQKPRVLGRWIFSFRSLPEKDKLMGWLSIFSCVCMFLIKIDHLFAKLLGSIAILVFYFSCLRFCLRFLLWQKQNVDLTFSIVNGILQNIDDYTSQMQNITQNNIHSKAFMISESLIEDDISSLNYRLRKVNLIHILYASLLCIVFVYVSTSEWIDIIKRIAILLNFGDFKIITNLNKENFTLLFLFPLGIAFLKDVFISSLQKRNQCLRRSLVILRHVNDEKLSVLNENTLHSTSSQRRSPPVSIAGRGKTLGDIVNPIMSEEDWECLK